MNLEKKILIISITFLLIFFLLITPLIYPLFKDIKNYSQELFSIKKDLMAIEEKSKELSAWQEKYSTLKPDLQKLEDLFVDPEMPINFLDFLEKIARDSNVLIEISLLPSREKEKLNFRLVLAGSFPNCLKFLEKLEAAPYLIEIKDLSSKNLTEAQLKSEKYKEFSLGDVEFDLSIFVFTR